MIVTLNFLLVHLAPGNAADVLAGESGSATPQYMAFLRHRFGLDQPLYVQYLDYLKNVVSLDLGYSFREGMPVRDLILQRLGPTLLLMGTTIVLSVGIGILLGLVAAGRPNSWRDNVISVVRAGVVRDAAVLGRAHADRAVLDPSRVASDEWHDEHRGVLHRLAEGR